MVKEVKITLGIPLGRTDALRFQEAAGARHMTQAEYQVALLDLHDAVRELVDHEVDPDGMDLLASLKTVLTTLGLQTVVR